MAAGAIVILNGTSSAGKTSLAEAFRARREDAGECWVVIGIDDFLGRLPPRWISIPGYPGDLGAAGAHVVTERDRTHFEFGPVGQQLLGGYRRAARAFALTGLNVVVDDVVVDETAWRDWTTVLDGLAVTWVAVHCDPDEAARREVARGDRIPGLARGNAEIVHRFAAYDLELDALVTPAETLAAELDRAVAALRER